MYSTCLFCHAPLGANAAIESFPVGRRLAFDPAKGRLWVVCRRCERWNLAPLEERWEAIEECERAFRGTTLRASTDEIGLARLAEGVELVRIGAPQRPEMAAWRYGDQFGRRRRRALAFGGAMVAAGAGWYFVGPAVGLVGAGSPALFTLFDGLRTLYLHGAVAARIPLERGGALVVRRDQVDAAGLRWSAARERWTIDVRHRRGTDDRAPWWRPDRNFQTTPLAGDDALRAARLLLPRVNAHGARAGTVRSAVRFLEEASAPAALFEHAARSLAGRQRWSDDPGFMGLSQLPAPVRLALEMAAHEETERRALEGELHLLAGAWRDAEEIAAIADDLLLPRSVEEGIARLKGTPDRT